MEQIKRIVSSIADGGYLELPFVVADGWGPRKAQQVDQVVDDKRDFSLERIELVRVLSNIADDMRETSVRSCQHQEEYSKDYGPLHGLGLTFLHLIYNLCMLWLVEDKYQEVDRISTQIHQFKNYLKSLPFATILPCVSWFHQPYIFMNEDKEK